MDYSFRKYTFDEIYVPVSERFVIDEEHDLLAMKPIDEIPFPLNDGSIIASIVRYYLLHCKFKRVLTVAKALNVDSRDLSSAVHILTDMNHDDLLRNYRLRAINELLTTTSLSNQCIATFFGYPKLHAFNRFLTDQTGLTANEIRAGKSPDTKVKRLPWWKL